LLSGDDRKVLVRPAQAPPVLTGLDRALASIWYVYAARADLRALIAGDTDPLPKARLNPDQFLGTYDLTPLDKANVGVAYLQKTVEFLTANGIPVLAFMTPTNHRLLHQFIDDPAYGQNGSYLKALLKRNGAKVLDLDRAFPTDEFIDNAHLTPAGQRRLASILSAAIAAEEARR
jgi:hypothetical protein